MFETRCIGSGDGAGTKLLCVDQFAESGGAQKSLLDLLDAFSQKGWKPSVAAPDDSPLCRKVESDGYPYYNLRCGEYTSQKKSLAEHLKYALNVPRLVRSLEQLVRAHNINLLYVNGGRLFFPSALIAKRVGIPVVFHIHNRMLQASAIMLAGRSVQWSGGHLIACCRYAAAPLSKYVGPGGVSVLYNGVAAVEKEVSRGPDRPTRIGVVGRVEEAKGQLEFVNAARLVARNYPDCRFSVIGKPMFSGTEYYQKVVAASRGLPVEFIDWQDNLAALYSGLDLVVVPSSCVESTTRVILEAYSAGVPVVAFPSGGIPEVLQDNETGFLTEGVTCEALARRITSVLQMETHKLMAVVAVAKRIWVQNFTLEGYREGVCRVLSRVAQQR